MLSASGEAVYIHEPLNPLHAPGIFGRRVERFYLLVRDENENELLPAFRDTLAFRYRLGPQLRATHSPGAAWVALKDVVRFTTGRLLNLRPLLKDPFAVLSIPWFVERLGADVVAVIRHPVACISSLKRLDWKFNPTELLSQHIDDAGRFAEYARLQEKMRTSDIVGHGALLWSLIATVLLEARTSGLARVARHEDLATQPLAGFGALYESLGLNLNRRARHRIARSTSSQNPAQSSIKKFERIDLDSRASLLNWAYRLDSSDVRRIYELTQPIRGEFYPHDDWVERLFREKASSLARA